MTLQVPVASLMSAAAAAPWFALCWRDFLV
jgi:hypothetical protein